MNKESIILNSKTALIKAEPETISTKADNPLMLLQEAANLIDQTTTQDTEETKSKNQWPSLESRRKVQKLPDQQDSSREKDIYLFRTAAATGDLETVNKLLKANQIHPGVCNNIALIEAAKNGHLHICQRLLQDSRTNPTDQRNYAIRMAVRNGHLQILKLFLEHSKADPSSDNNYPIRVASINGHLEIVKLLLQDSRIDPSTKDNYPIRYASKNDHWEIVDLLLQDPRVKLEQVLAASRKNYRSFQPLIEKVESILLKKMNELKKQNVSDISTNFREPVSPVSDIKYSPVKAYVIPNLQEILLYSAGGKKSELETFINGYKFSFFNIVNRSIIAAAEFGHLDTLKVLMKEFPQHDLNYDNGSAIKLAIKNHHTEVVEYLNSKINKSAF